MRSMRVCEKWHVCPPYARLQRLLGFFFVARAHLSFCKTSLSFARQMWPPKHMHVRVTDVSLLTKRGWVCRASFKFLKYHITMIKMLVYIRVAMKLNMAIFFHHFFPLRTFNEGGGVCQKQMPRLTLNFNEGDAWPNGCFAR